MTVVHYNHASILHRYGNLKSQRYWGHDLDLLGSRDVIDHVTIGLGVGTFLLVVNMGVETGGAGESSCSPNFWHGEQAIALAPPKV